MHLDLTWISWFSICVVGYYTAMFVLAQVPRRASAPLDGRAPIAVLVVPAHNEEAVIGATVDNLLAIDDAVPYRVLVVDDGSDDGTAAILRARAGSDDRLRVIRRTPEQGGQGKSEVLNHAYDVVRTACLEQDPWLEGRAADKVLLAVVDADGRLERDVLGVVAPYFSDPYVGGVQIGVRIYNAGHSILTRLQDMEFVGFTQMVQTARDRIGSAGLGGNGQFTRLSALISLGARPWKSSALTEDLDLGLRLIESGWRTRFCPRTTVAQQGLPSWRPLLRQRTRWIQGYYQCWSHLPRLARASGTTVLGRADIMLYLVMVLTVAVISFGVLASIGDYLGLVSVSTSPLPFTPDGTALRVLTLVLSVLPVGTVLVTYQWHAHTRLRLWEIPFFALVFTAYCYAWSFTTVRAWVRMALRRNSWVKTPRVDGGDGEALVAGAG